MMDRLPNNILCVGMPDHPVSLSTTLSIPNIILPSQILSNTFPQVLLQREVMQTEDSPNEVCPLLKSSGKRLNKQRAENKIELFG